jgi:dTDP-4-dehydrorhamnose 3,5-epimerase
MLAPIHDVLITPLKVIPGPLGEVRHLVKRSSPGFEGFGEVYFSQVAAGAIKGWKRHSRMTLNLAVPVGAAEFLIHDDRADSSTRGVFQLVNLSRDDYRRLTVPPGLWLAFRGVDPFNLVVNVASIEHDPAESDAVDFHSGVIHAAHIWPDAISP